MAACHLARAGWQVVVVEQDPHVGGTAHVFRRQGYVFPAGPLSFTVPGYLAYTLQELGIEQPLSFWRAVFQVVRPPLDAVISVPLRQLELQLVKQFPAERMGISEVVGILEDLIPALRAAGRGLVLGSSRAIVAEDGRAVAAGNDQAGVTGEGWSRPLASSESAADGVAEGVSPVPSAAGASARGERPAGASFSREAAQAVLARWERVSARTVMERYLRHPALRDLLGSQGTSEPVMSMVLLAQMWDFMAVEGIWYPVEGIDVLGRLLAQRFAELGGVLGLGTRVAGITVEKGRVVGVKLDDGSAIVAPVVVSDADYRQTVLDLLPVSAVEESQRDLVASLPLSPSAFTVFLGVDRSKVDLSLFRGHHILTKLEEGPSVPWHEKQLRAADFLRDELWLSWWSRHDPCLAPPGREALMVKVMAPFAPAAAFDTSTVKRRRPSRSAAYQAWKRDMATAVVQTAAQLLPGLVEAVEVQEVATPLTYRDWGHRSEGSVAGWSWRVDELPDSWARALVVGPVPGLYMVGLQSFTRLFFGGAGTSAYSGRLVAEMVLGRHARLRVGLSELQKALRRVW